MINPQYPLKAAALTVIMPAYNEEASIGAAVAEVQQQVLGAVPGSELIVINDGSRDQTGLILDRLAAQNANLRVIHQSNGGHGVALITGLSNTSAEFVLLVDSDQQIPLDEFGEFWEQKQQGFDCVFGVRRVRHDAEPRILLTWFIRHALTMLFRIRIYDANVPYKLIRRSIWEQAEPYIPNDTLAPSLFLAIFAVKRGYRIRELDVRHKNRETGEVSIRKLKLLKFCIKAFGQLWKFRQTIR